MFEVGKKVIAVKNPVSGKFKKGDVFELLGIRKGLCGCHPVLLDIGKKTIDGKMGCLKCGAYIYAGAAETHWFSAGNFAPYDDSLSELTAEQILNEEAVIA